MKNTKDEPMQLIGYNSQQQRFTINQEALEMIKEIKGPIGVISVVGIYRTGKSFLMNRLLLNRKQGFKVSSTVQSQTKGIWIWGKPILGQTQKNQTINILILDTEGISSLDQQINYDLKIITMSVLLSSLLIYNSIGAIQKNQVETLSQVLKLVNKISDQSVESQLSLLWILRDFSLQLKSTQHIPLTANEYLEQTLKSTYSNRYEKQIFGKFKKIDCATLIRPLIDQNSFQYLDIADYQSLVPEFVEQIIELRKRVLGNIAPKMFGSKVLNGESWVNMVRGYINQLNNSNKMPQLSSIWEYVCQSQCSKHSQIALEGYKNKLQEGLKKQISQQAMKTLYKQSKQEAISYIESKCKNNNQLPFYLNELKEIFSQEYIKVMNNLHKNHLDQIKDFLGFQYQSIERKLKLKQISTLWDYKKQIQMFLQFAKKKAGNHIAKEYVNDFITKKIFQTSNYFNQQIINQSNSKRQQLSSNILKLQEQLKSLRKKETQEKLDHQLKISQYQQQLKQLSLANHRLQQTTYQLKTQKQQSQKSYWNQLTNEKSNYQKIINEYKVKLSLSQNKIDQINRQKIILESELKKKDILEEKLVENHDQVLKDQKESYGKLMKEFGMLKESYYGEIRVSDQKHGQRVKEYLAVIEELRGNLAECEARIGEMRGNINGLEGRNRELQQEKKVLSSQINSLRGEQESESRLLNKKLAESKFKLEKSVHLEQEIHTLTQQAQKLKQANKQLSNELDKQKALNDQKYHFIQIQLKESQSKNEQYEEKFKEILTNFNMEKIKLEQQLNQHRNKQFQLKKTINYHQISIEELRLKNTDYKLLLEQKEQQINNTVRIYKEKQQNVQNSRIMLENELRKLQSDNFKQNRINEKNLQQEIGRLNKQILRLKQEYESDIQDIKLSFEQTLVQIRSLHEIQKTRIENKLAEEKNKKDKRYLGIEKQIENQEMNKNIRETNQKLQDEVLQLKKRIWNDEKEYKIKMSEFETKIILKNSEIDEIRNNTTINIGRLGSKDNDIENKVLKVRIAQQKKEIQQKSNEIKKLLAENLNFKQSLKIKNQEVNKITMNNEVYLNKLQQELEQQREQTKIYKVRMMESIDDHSEYKKTVFNKHQSILNQNKYLQSKILMKDSSLYSPIGKGSNNSFLKKSRIQGKIMEALREVEAIEHIYGDAVKDVSKKQQRYDMDLQQVKREKKVLQKKMNLMMQL